MKIVIKNKVERILVEQYIESLPNETGGVLFGYYDTKLETAIVTDVFYKIEDSIKKRKSFIRGKSGFKKFSTKMWAENRYYLGEWHTHPLALPNMSIQDKKQLIKIRDNKNLNCPEPILVIVGEKKQEITMKGYIFFKNVIYSEEIII